MLKITNITAIPISIPLKKPMHMSGRNITCTKNLIVCVEVDGLIGWGEAASAPRMTGDILPGMVAVVNDFYKPLLLNTSALDYIQLSEKINKFIYGNTGVKSAINSALLDLVSRYQQTPVHTMLGKKIRSDFDIIQILGNGTHEEDLEEVRNSLLSGINFFKIKIGRFDIEHEISFTHKLRDLIGRNGKLCVDANAGLDMDDLKTYAAGVDGVDVMFIEQPLYDLEQMSAILPSIKIPICVDESVSHLRDIDRIYFEKAGHGVNLKNIKLGGPLNLIEAANLSASHNLKINISSKVAETGIATSMMLHCASVVPNVDWGVSTTNQLLECDVIMDSTNNEFEVDQYIIKHFMEKI